MSKPTFSILPDSLINIGTGFGILLGLAVGLMSGLMIAPVPTTTQSANIVTLPDTQERNNVTMQTLLIQRASILANILRLQASGQTADAPIALLERNTSAIATSVSLATNKARGNQFSQALSDQALAAQAVVFFTATNNTSNIPDAQKDLQATNEKLVGALVSISNSNTTSAASVGKTVTTALVNLVAAAKQSTSYQAEANLVTSFDQLATFIRSTRR